MAGFRAEFARESGKVKAGVYRMYSSANEPMFFSVGFT